MEKKHENVHVFKHENTKTCMFPCKIFICAYYYPPPPPHYIIIKVCSSILKRSSPPRPGKLLYKTLIVGTCTFTWYYKYLMGIHVHVYIPISIWERKRTLVAMHVAMHVMFLYGG